MRFSCFPEHTFFIKIMLIISRKAFIIVKDLSYRCIECFEEI